MLYKLFILKKIYVNLVLDKGYIGVTAVVFTYSYVLRPKVIPQSPNAYTFFLMTTIS